jgi:hypothetical protein
MREFLESIKTDADKPEPRLAQRKFITNKDSFISHDKQINSSNDTDSKNSIQYDLSELYA